MHSAALITPPTSIASTDARGHSSWKAKDDEVLIQARAQGLNWNQISPKHFPTKSANACRKRHERLMERENNEQCDGVKLEDLAQAYMDVRREAWSILAARVGEKWTLVEQKCMDRGLGSLVQAARAAQRKSDEGLGEEPADMLPSIPENHFVTYAGGYPSPQSRVPSIQSMIHP
ncbi:hypothetical protein CC86DRAFT_286076, partial [Ophiobolus disseminans]